MDDHTPEEREDGKRIAELEREIARLRHHKVLLEALGRHVEFQVHEHGFPCFNMIDPERRRELASPLTVEVKRFLEQCFHERFE